MTTLELLNYCIKAHGVLRELDAMSEFTTYGELSESIGMPKYQSRSGPAYDQIAMNSVLGTLDAIDYQANGRRTVRFERVLNARTGEPGVGVARQNRIVRDPEPSLAIVTDMMIARATGEDL